MASNRKDMKTKDGGSGPGPSSTASAATALASNAKVSPQSIATAQHKDPVVSAIDVTVEKLKLQQAKIKKYAKEHENPSMLETNKAFKIKKSQYADVADAVLKITFVGSGIRPSTFSDDKPIDKIKKISAVRTSLNTLLIDLENEVKKLNEKYIAENSRLYNVFGDKVLYKEGEIAIYIKDCIKEIDELSRNPETRKLFDQVKESQANAAAELSTSRPRAETDPYDDVDDEPDKRADNDDTTSADPFAARDVNGNLLVTGADGAKYRKVNK